MAVPDCPNDRKENIYGSSFAIVPFVHSESLTTGSENTNDNTCRIGPVRQDSIGGYRIVSYRTTSPLRLEPTAVQVEFTSLSTSLEVIQIASRAPFVL